MTDEERKSAIEVLNAPGQEMAIFPRGNGQLGISFSANMVKALECAVEALENYHGDAVDTESVKGQIKGYINAYTPPEGYNDTFYDYYIRKGLGIALRVVEMDELKKLHDEEKASVTEETNGKNVYDTH